MSTMPTRDQQLESTFKAALGSRPAATTGTAPLGGMLEGRKQDRTLFLLAINRIRPDAEQVRRMNKGEDDADIRELAESVRQFGIIEPLNVRYLQVEDVYQLIAGERRYTAAKIVGLAEVPVKLVDADEKQARLRQLHENIHRADLHPVELAAALQTLMDEGASVDALATMLNKSVTFVRKSLSIASELTPAAKAQIAERPDKFTSVDHLYEVAKLPPEQQTPTLAKIADENLSRNELRQATAAAKAEHRQARGETRGRKAAPAKPYSQNFSSANGAKLVISFRKAKVGTEEVIAALEDVLAQLRA